VPRIVVLGAGLAGATAASTLRAEGYDGEVVLVGAEAPPPYERPPLSKEYLRGETAEPQWVRPAGWWDEQRVELRLGTRVERLDPDDRAVVLAGGERLPFDGAVVATGVRNRRLPVPGADLPGVFDLRTLADADALRDAARSATGAVVVGGGFIGCEVAASLRQLGLDVTIVEFFDTTLYRVLGLDLGRTVEALHRDHGVRFALGEAVERLEGTGRFEAVVTKEGRTIGGDIAVVGVGTEPVVEGLDALRIAASGGVWTDARLRTSVPGVAAAGDVAAHEHPVFGPIRVEHYDNAIKMGETAARNLLGRDEVFTDAHWFWSDQYDSQIQMAGYATEWDRTVVRGSFEERSFAAFLLRDGVLRAAVSLDRPRDVRRTLPLIAAEVRPDPDLLADPGFDLRQLAPPREPSA
jgi:3-phenylpropionate/trans-cinnamate dioxygenase ferredoxin reductase component